MLAGILRFGEQVFAGIVEFVTLDIQVLDGHTVDLEITGARDQVTQSEIQNLQSDLTAEVYRAGGTIFDKEINDGTEPTRRLRATLTVKEKAKERTLHSYRPSQEIPSVKVSVFSRTVDVTYEVVGTFGARRGIMNYGGIRGPNGFLDQFRKEVTRKIITMLAHA